MLWSALKGAGVQPARATVPARMWLAMGAVERVHGPPIGTFVAHRGKDGNYRAGPCCSRQGCPLHELEAQPRA